MIAEAGIARYVSLVLWHLKPLNVEGFHLLWQDLPPKRTFSRLLYYCEKQTRLAKSCESMSYVFNQIYHCSLPFVAKAFIALLRPPVNVVHHSQPSGSTDQLNLKMMFWSICRLLFSFNFNWYVVVCKRTGIFSAELRFQEELFSSYIE